MKNYEISYNEHGCLSEKYERIWSLPEDYITIPQLISNAAYHYYLDSYVICMDKENGTFVLTHILVDNRYSESLESAKVISFDTVKELLANEIHATKNYIEKETNRKCVKGKNDINGVKERLLKLERIVNTTPTNWRNLLNE